MTVRDRVEDFLLKEFKDSVKPFTPENYQLINKYKDGSFGISTVAFSLYSNGHNKRGVSSKYKYGLIFEDGNSLFSIGYFCKEENDEYGYLFIVAPTGVDVLKKVDIFSTAVMNKIPNLIKGVYVRYLNLDSYVKMLNKGYVPAKEHPFFPEAPEEDETLCNSLIKLEDLVEYNEGKLSIKIVGELSRTSRKKAKYEFNRFTNFLERNNLKFRLQPLTKRRLVSCKAIIEKHFEMLESQSKNIGSTSQDHYNSLDIMNFHNPDCRGFVGYLNDNPVSVYVGEKLIENKFGLYTSFSFRDIDKLSSLLNLDSNSLAGLSAISRYSYLVMLGELKRIGYEYVDLGGSELPDLNKYKRRFGAKINTSYWVYKSNSVVL